MNPPKHKGTPMGGLFSRLTLIILLILSLNQGTAAAQSGTVPPQGPFQLEVSPWPPPERVETEETRELRIGTGVETNSLNPGEQTSSLASNLCDLIYDTFFSRTPAGALQARLATGLAFSPDGLEATLNLRKGVRFGNNEPLTASAVKSTWDRLLDPGTIVPLGWNLNPVKECLVLDDHTVLLRLKHPYPALGSILSLSLCSPVSLRAAERWGVNLRNHPVGAGPYALKEWIRGKRIVLERNEHYYGARPTVKRLIWEIVPTVNQRRDMLKSGRLDICSTPYPADIKALKALPGLGIASPLSTRSHFLIFNCRTGPLQDRTVRQALNLAVNKQRIIETVLHGTAEPMSSPVSPVLGGAPPRQKIYAHDPAKAAELLRKSSFDFSRPVRIMGCKLRFPYQDKILELIRKDLLAVGVKAEVGFLDWPSFLAELNRPPEQTRTDAFLLDRSSLIPDPGPALRERFHSQAALPGNRMGALYANPDLDRLLNRSQNEPDPDRRANLLRRAEALVWEDCPWLWLYTDRFLVAYDTRIKNLIITPTEKIYPQEAVRE